MNAGRIRSLLARLKEVGDDQRTDALEVLAMTLMMMEEQTVPAGSDTKRRLALTSINETLDSNDLTRVTLADLKQVQKELR